VRNKKGDSKIGVGNVFGISLKLQHRAYLPVLKWASLGRNELN
jgi:hypothetical protein